MDADGALDVQTESLAAQRDAVYASITELDFDHEMGNLSNKDYADLRERYTRKAVSILKTLDAQQSETALQEGADDDVEREVAAVRRARRDSVRPATTADTAAGPRPESTDDEIEREVAAVRRAKRGGVRPVTNTGSAARPSQERATIPRAKPATQACPACKAPNDPGDAFCRRCGAALAAQCPSCGFATREDDDFCARCGQQL